MIYFGHLLTVTAGLKPVREICTSNESGRQYKIMWSDRHGKHQHIRGITGGSEHFWNSFVSSRSVFKNNALG